MSTLAVPRAQSPISIPGHDISSSEVNKTQVFCRSSVATMKPFALLLLLVLAAVAVIARGLEVDAQGTHLRHLQVDPGDDQSDDQQGDDNGDDDNEQFGGRCYPGSWNWPRCRYGGGGGGGCYPGSWNWPRCRHGGNQGGCYPGSWDWPRCRYGGGGGCYRGSWNWPRCRHW